MKLSIVIVNYNVKYFLATCLQSVEKAIEKLDAEVFVVDNNSTDGSVEMIREDYAWVKLIANDFNAGFSKANNQAIFQSEGEYVLLLNPDTIVEEACFEKCIDYLDEHSDVGGMGVRMIDGSGKFLPESKRGLPTPSVAFYKIFGLASLFPKSRVFGKYHLGYLSEFETAEIEVLSGAFMLMRKSVIDKIGGLDESFFMYGEDIDMSYRITEAGYKNVYFPHSKIIHFKGESTKKSSVNYVLVFYRAMIIFAKKHFSSQNASLLSFLINLAIYLRAFVALTNRFFRRIYMPLIDLALLWGMLFGIKEFYESQIIGSESYFPQKVEILAFPIIISCWLLGQLLMGGYHQPVKLKNVFKGLGLGGLMVVVLYAMLDESLRFSRAIVFMSIAATFLILPLSRIFLMKLSLFRLIRFTEVNSGIIGFPESIRKVQSLLSWSAERKKHPIFINPLRKSEEDFNEVKYESSLYQLRDAIRILDIDEVIFCMKDVSSGDMINAMQICAPNNLGIYIHPKEGDFLLRSASNNRLGDFVLPETDVQLARWSRKKKRLFEILLSALLILTFPFLFFVFRKPLRYFGNMWKVLFGKINLIGMSGPPFTKDYLIDIQSGTNDETEQNRRRMSYTANYGTERDLELVFANFSSLDQEASHQNS